MDTAAEHQTHTLTILRYPEDHKRGYFQGQCSCGWEGHAFYSSTTFRDSIKQRLHQEWREHVPEGLLQPFGVCEGEDGSAHTGQAVVYLTQERGLVWAFTTRLTPVALYVRGFRYEYGDVDDAADMIFPAASVESIESRAWYEDDDIHERDVTDDELTDALRAAVAEEEARWQSE